MPHQPLHGQILRQTATDLDDDSHGLLPSPRPLTRPHLEHHTTNTPNIDLGIVTTLSSVDHLGSHPEDSALHGSKHSLLVDIVRPFGNSKIRYLALAVLFDQNVVRFQVL